MTQEEFEQRAKELDEQNYPLEKLKDFIQECLKDIESINPGTLRKIIEARTLLEEIELAKRSEESK